MLKELEVLLENDKDLSPFVFEGYHGIKFPKLRKIAKIVAKEKRYNFFKEKHVLIEETIIHAFAIGYCKEDIKTLLSFVKDFMPQINSWSVNDALCQNMRFAKIYQNEVYEFLSNYKDSSNEWEVRVIAVTMLSHFLNDEYIDKFFEMMDYIHKDTYMSKMGVAWAIATAMAKYPNKTFAYLKNNKLDKWTYNKAIQKMIESFRVSDDNKQILKQMKK